MFGDRHTHDRLVRELTNRAEAATVLVSYDLSFEVRYPVAIEQLYATLEWIGEHGGDHDFVMLHALAETQAAKAATTQGGEFLRTVLWDR